MKIRITFDLHRDERRAIAHRTRHGGAADHAECAQWIEGNIRATLDVLVAELEADEEEDRRNPGRRWVVGRGYVPEGAT